MKKLITNYTNHNAKVRYVMFDDGTVLTLPYSNPDVEFIIANNGHGIDKADVYKLLKPFAVLETTDLVYLNAIRNLNGFGEDTYKVSPNN